MAAAVTEDVPAAERARNAPPPAPTLAPGVEPVGEFQGSGTELQTYLVRRGSAMLQVSELLYNLIGLLDSHRDTREIALALSEKLGRSLTSDQVRYLLEKKIEPLGLLAGTDPSRLAPRREQIFQLRLRFPLLPAAVVRALAYLLRPLFYLPLVVVVIAAWVGADVWLFRGSVLSSAVRNALHQPRLIVWASLVMLGVAVFHELGHATGCRAGGARPGRIGAGVYVAFPAMYTDVTDSYRLSRWGRLRTDLGGVYFELVAMVAMAAAYQRWHWTPLVIAILLDQLTVLEQFYPFARFDGYYVMADLAGVPEPFEYLRAALVHVWRLLRRRPRPDTGLTRRSLRLLAAWGTLGTVFIPVSLFLLARTTPGLFSSARHAVVSTSAAVSRDAGSGRIGAAIGQSALCLVTLLPAAGVTVAYALLARRLGTIGVLLRRKRALRRAQDDGVAPRHAQPEDLVPEDPVPAAPVPAGPIAPEAVIAEAATPPVAEHPTVPRPRKPPHRDRQAPQTVPARKRPAARSTEDSGGSPPARPARSSPSAKAARREATPNETPARGRARTPRGDAASSQPSRTRSRAASKGRGAQGGTEQAGPARSRPPARALAGVALPVTAALTVRPGGGRYRRTRRVLAIAALATEVSLLVRRPRLPVVPADRLPVTWQRPLSCLRDQSVNGYCHGADGATEIFGSPMWLGGTVHTLASSPWWSWAERGWPLQAARNITRKWSP